jgi:glycosyltransferase involved in cell wall biosynthesis
MRIGIDATFLFDQYANRGIGTYGKEVIKQLLQDQSQDWFLFGYGNANNNFSELKIKQTANVRFISLGQKRKSGIKNIWFFKFNYLPKIKKAKLDLFFASHFEAGLPLGVTKVAVTMHDVIPYITNKFSSKNPVFNYLKGLFYKYNLRNARKADLIITDSDFSRNELINKAGFDQVKVKRIYLGVKDIFRQVNITDSQRDIRRTLITYNITSPYLIYYGGIEPNKNVESLLRSFESITHRFPDLKLVIIGHEYKLGWDNKVKPLSSHAQYFYNLCEELKIKHKVVFTGEVNENHLPIILANARLMIHLSTYEGFGFSVLESLAAGIPLIAANKSCYPEVLADSAQLVDPLNIKEIAAKIEELLTNTKLYESMQTVGLKRAEIFTWKNTGQETRQALYNIKNVKKTLRILYVSPFFYPFKGGAENNCLALAQSMANSGSNVTVFTSIHKEYPAAKSEVYQNIKIRRFKRWNNLYYLNFIPGLLWALLREKADVIHVVGFGFIWHDFCIFLKKIVSPKTIFINTPHGPFMALDKYSFLATLLKRSYTSILKLTLNWNYNIIIEDNPKQREWITKYNIKEDKIRFLSIGIPAEIFKPNPDYKITQNKYNLNRKFVISFVGRFEEYKGLQYIISAVNILRDEIKTLRLVAIGLKGNYFDTIIQQIQDLKLQEYVEILPNADETTKFDILEVSNIFVWPSQWEAFGISILEAMAKNNAIITTRTEGGNFLIETGKNGYLVDFKNPEQIAEKILLLYKDKVLLEQIKNDNLAKAKTFIWENIILDYEKILYEQKT